MVKVKNPFKRWLISNNIFSLVVCLVVSVISFAALVNSIIIGDPVKVGLAAAALILYGVPFIVTTFFKISIPAALEVIFYLFIFASLILGEVFAFYGPFPFWDVILHFLSGFVCASIGFALVKTMAGRKVSAFFTLLMSFCFSITIGAMWECLEFTFDMTARTDAQKDAIVKNISTITMQRDGGNQPVRINGIEETKLFLTDGETITIEEGFLDIGLMDTMKDLLTNMAGAIIFCIIGVFYLKDNKNIKFVDSFIPTKV